MRKITKGEREVLKLIYYSDKEISEMLYLSLSAVKYRLRSLSDKLHFAKSKVQILVNALNDGVITLDEIKTTSNGVVKNER